MNLPSFMWLWQIAAWSMGLTMGLYIGLLVVGAWLRRQRQAQQSYWRPKLRLLHMLAGWVMALLVLLLLAIGIIGTLGHYGSLGHSWHLPMGVGVVGLTLMALWSGMRIIPEGMKGRSLHLRINGLLGAALILVLISGWQVVQKYMP